MNRFEPGVLDKLFGDGPNQPAPAVARQLSLDELKGTVARHLESLLNVRITFTDEHLVGLTECKRSVLTYGPFEGHRAAGTMHASVTVRPSESADYA